MFVINATKIQNGGTSLTVVPHVCGVCKKAFLQECTLLKHLHSHDEENTADESLNDSSKKITEDDNPETNISEANNPETNMSKADNPENNMSENDDPDANISNDDDKESVLEEAIEEVTSPAKKERYQVMADSNLVIIENEPEAVEQNETPVVREQQTDEIEDEKNHSCDLCEKTFSSKIYLYRHIKLHTGYRKYQCDLCRRSFVLKENLVKHRSSHMIKKVYYCLECNKTFPSSLHRRMHEFVKTGKKTNVCPTCDKAFTIKANLVRHMFIHTNEGNKFSCNMCGKKFVSDPFLQKHLKLKGQHGPTFSQAQPADGSVVTKPFKRMGLHDKKPLYKVNLKKKSHFCKTCGEGFTSKKSMMKHRRFNHAKGDYFCGLCNRGFTNRKNLQKHFLKHTSGRMFGCEIDS